MNNRRLSLLVLVVVAAVALSVHWYLAAETAAAPPMHRDEGELILDSSAEVTAVEVPAVEVPAVTAPHAARIARVAGSAGAPVSDS